MTPSDTTPRFNRLLRRITRIIMLAVIIGYALALSFYLITRLLVGDGLWWLAFLNDLAPFAFLPLLAFWPLAMVLRSKWAVLLQTPLVIIGLLWFGPYFLPKSASAPTNTSLQVVTFNVWGGNTHFDEIGTWLRTTDADLVLLQEIPPSYSENLRPALLDLYPYQAGQPLAMQVWGQLALSRYPISDVDYLDMESDGAPTQQRLTLDIGGQSVVVYNVHFMMPMRESPRLVLPGEAFWLDMLLKYDSGGRDHQITVLLEHVAEESGPILVAGDFNMSDQALIYETVAAHLHDTFREAGMGFGWSWPISEIAGLPDWIPPVMRLDYIWHSDHFRAFAANTGPRLGSDHLPHMATFELCDGICQ